MNKRGTRYLIETEHKRSILVETEQKLSFFIENGAQSPLKKPLIKGGNLNSIMLKYKIEYKLIRGLLIVQ